MAGFGATSPLARVSAKDGSRPFSATQTSRWEWLYLPQFRHCHPEPRCGFPDHVAFHRQRPGFLVSTWCPRSIKPLRRLRLVTGGMLGPA
jgi:hypothetical protein